MLRRYFRNPLRGMRKCMDGGYATIFRKVGFIGDSLSSGEHESTLENGEKGYHDYMEYSWGQFMARKCSFEGLNFSRGGLTAKVFLEDYAPNVNNPFVEEKKCQAYYIALGVNDINHLDDVYQDGFGSLDDVDFENEDNNKMSYVGQYVRIIQKLRKLEPKCRIFVVTTPTEAPESKKKREMFGKIASFLRELPSRFEFLYVIDLRKFAPIYNPKFGRKYFLGGHMSALGYKFTADMMVAYTDYIIRHNIDDFAQVGFIGKGVHNKTRKW